MLQDLKEREKGLLNSHNSRFIEYGKACKEILNLCSSFAGPRLSEQMLIADMAEKYANKEKELFDLTKNENHRLHIKVASEYYLKELVPFDRLYNQLAQETRVLTFEEAKLILAKDPELFVKVKTKTLVDVLKLIEVNLQEDAQLSTNS
jgi:hypothetical protein